jgi:hypothetical protein
MENNCSEKTSEHTSNADLCEDALDRKLENQLEEQRSLIDRIGDVFAKMVKGIFIFAFWKLPSKLWDLITDLEKLKKVLKWLKSIFRTIFYILLWIVIVFLGWWLFLKEKFIRFLLSVRDLLQRCFFHTLEFLKANAGWIWMIIALMGSAYGLAYVTLKHHAKKKGKEFRGVFGWLRRKKKDTSTNEINMNNKENPS